MLTGSGVTFLLNEKMSINLVSFQMLHLLVLLRTNNFFSILTLGGVSLGCVTLRLALKF